jgi:hypothetical protein
MLGRVARRRPRRIYACSAQSIVARARSPTSATISAMREPVDHGRDLTSETVGRADEHFDGYRSVYRDSLTDGKASAGRCGCGSESEWQPALAPRPIPPDHPRSHKSGRHPGKHPRDGHEDHAAADDVHDRAQAAAARGSPRDGSDARSLAREKPARMDRRAFLRILTGGVQACRLPSRHSGRRSPKVGMLLLSLETRRAADCDTAFQPESRARRGSHHGLLPAQERRASESSTSRQRVACRWRGVVTAPTRANAHRSAAEQRPFQVVPPI